MFEIESTHRVAVFANGYNFIGVKPLPEEEAIKSGAELISETIVLCIAGNIIIIIIGSFLFVLRRLSLIILMISYLCICIVATIVIVEYDRSERKNAIKAEKAAQKESLASRLLEERFARIETSLRELKEHQEKIQVLLFSLCNYYVDSLYCNHQSSYHIYIYIYIYFSSQNKLQW